MSLCSTDQSVARSLLRETVVQLACSRETTTDTCDNSLGIADCSRRRFDCVPNKWSLNHFDDSAVRLPGPDISPAISGQWMMNACCVRLAVRALSPGKACFMNTNPTTNPNSKTDDKKDAKPAVAATKPTAVASAAPSAAKPEACATTPKADACATTPKSDATSKPETQCKTYEGKVVSIKGDKLVMSNPEGKEFSHNVSADAKVCCDGKSCQTADLKVGSRIRVTSSPEDKHTATRIESLDKNAEFAKTA